MKINGSLVFDASSASEVQNLRLEKFGTNPNYSASDAGRLIYNTTSGIIFVGAGGNWVPLATGGDASALLAEVDRIEASAGLNSDGSFNAAAYSGSLASSTSIVNLFEKVQTLLAANATAIAGEATTARAAEVALGGRIDGEVTRATGAESALSTAIGTEAAARLAADNTLQSNIDAEAAARATAVSNEASARAGAITTEAAARVAGDATNATAIGAETTRATGVETTLQNNITAEASTARAAESANAAATTAEASTARAAELTLTNGLAAEITRASGVEAGLRTDLGTESTTARAAELTLTNNLSAEVSRATAAEAALAASQAAFAQGLSWKQTAKAATAGPIALTGTQTVDGVALVAGDRVLVKDQAVASQNGIYVVAAGAWARSTDMNIAAEFLGSTVFVTGTTGGVNVDVAFNEINTVNTIGTDPVAFTQITGGGSISAGAGLVQTGTAFHVGANGDGSITVNATDIQLSTALQTEIHASTSGLAAEIIRATAGEATVAAAVVTEHNFAAGALATEIADRITAVAAEATRATAAEGVLTADLASEVSRATAAEGANATAIGAEVTRATAAEGLLSAAIGAETTARTSAVSAEATARATAITTETNARIAADAAVTALVTAEASTARAAESAIVATATSDYNRVSKMYFLYDGASAAASHTVTHALGQQFCNVTVVDATDEMVIPQSVKFDTANQLTVTFNTSIACKVVVMSLA